jgi:hypothetical protein
LNAHALPIGRPGWIVLPAAILTAFLTVITMVVATFLPVIAVILAIVGSVSWAGTRGNEQACGHHSQRGEDDEDSFGFHGFGFFGSQG